VKPHSATAPKLAKWLLGVVVPADIREALLGDLDEAFHDHVLPARGRAGARRWYWAQALRAPVSLARRPHSHSNVSRGEAMTHLASDVAFGLRLLRRKPAFSLLVTLTLAAGIGATTAIFSVVYPILVKPLPYPDADRLTVVWDRDERGKGLPMGFATYADVAAQSRSFDAVGAFSNTQVAVSGNDGPQEVPAVRVTASYFDVTRVMPQIGRRFSREEDMPGGGQVIILSDGFWRSRFGGDRSIVGRKIDIDESPATVIGVMPPAFRDALVPDAQAWLPLQEAATLPWACRACRHLTVIARLRAGVDRQSAVRELGVLGANLARQHPKEYPGVGMNVNPLGDAVTGGVRKALLAVAGAALLILVITCANVANLLLARAGQRRGELAVRTAVGASAFRIVRQLLTESTLLSILGSGLGAAAAWASVRILISMGPLDLRRRNDVGVNGTALVFSIVAAVVVGIIVGLVPALQARHADLHEDIKRGSRRSSARARSTRSAFVVTEIALALVVMVGAGLLVRSSRSLMAIDPGLDPAHVLTLQLQAPTARVGRSDTTVRLYFDQILGAVRALPGVAEVGLTTAVPLTNELWGLRIHPATHPNVNPELDPMAQRYAVSPSYLTTMRIRRIKGRDFTDADGVSSPLVIQVSQTLANELWPNEDPIGQRARVDSPTGPWRTVVGVVGDVKTQSLSDDKPAAVYLPGTQWPWADATQSLVIRARGNAAALAPDVQRAIWSVNSRQAITRLATMDQVIAATADNRRFTMVLFEVFAAIAALLAATGLYGVISGSVSERLREIGIRTALGATSASVASMFLREALALAAAGAAAGLAIALLATRLMTSLLFNVASMDPPTYGAAIVILFGVAGVACLIPVRRAAAVDPARVLIAD
jgi:putative ABC transport system permease protein